MIRKKIKNYLEERGISQTFLAEKTKMPLNILNPTLNGKRKLLTEEYFTICEALGVPLDTFKENQAS